jgi:high-affinity Fe2+/Pb2+ permease
MNIKKIKKIKKANKYQMSITAILLAAAMLIICVWYWFDANTRELEQQMNDAKAGHQMSRMSN